VTFEELDRWLDVYSRAWERKGVDAFVACFTEDAIYAWGLWAEPLRATTRSARQPSARSPRKRTSISFTNCSRSRPTVAATAGASRLPCQVERRLGTSLNS
jgi:hypothetical protein